YGVLSRIDPATRTVAGTTSVNGPVAVAVGRDAVWVTSRADGTVSKIDPSSGRLEGAFPVAKEPSGVAVAADGHVWVAGPGSATLTELNPATGHVIPPVATGAAPSGVALDGETAYVAAQAPPSARRGGKLTRAVANPPGIERGDLPSQRARSRLPAQARAARVRRRPGLDAASCAAAAARDRPVHDRRLEAARCRRPGPQPALPRLVDRGAAAGLPGQD